MVVVLLSLLLLLLLLPHQLQLLITLQLVPKPVCANGAIGKPNRLLPRLLIIMAETMSHQPDFCSVHDHLA